VNAFQTF